MSGRATHSGADEPAEILSGVWDLLDELPPAEASARLAATTVEMAAVTAERSAEAPRLRQWIAPAAVVTAALVAGIVAGRLTSPPGAAPPRGQLPIVAHLDLLREAGSVGFLARMAGRPGPPPRLLLAAPGGARKEVAEFDARLADLGRMLSTVAVEPGPRPPQSGPDRRVELERAAREFAGLSPAEQRQLAEVARALVDPTRPALREAARVWHLWVAASDPADRRSIVALDTEERLEWLDRRARFEARVNGRAREFDRRGPPREGEGRPEPPRRPPPQVRSDAPRPPGETRPPQR
jgi:hypothetical protein